MVESGRVDLIGGSACGIRQSQWANENEHSYSFIWEMREKYEMYANIVGEVV